MGPTWSRSLDAGKLQSDKGSIKTFAFIGQMGGGAPPGAGEGADRRRDALRAEGKMIQQLQHLRPCCN